jgi:hypothetical protein
MPDPDFSDLDFSSSRPVESASAQIDPLDMSDLDLSTTANVHQSESVLDEDRGIVFDMPTGTDGKEQEYLIKTQHEKRDGGGFLGMEYIGDFVVGGGKGVARTGLGMVSDITEVFRTTLEAQLNPEQIEVSADNVEAIQRLSQSYIETRDASQIRTIHHAGVKKFQENYDTWVERLPLKPEGAVEGAAFEFMAAGTSTVGAIGLTILTKNPALIAPLFGLMEGGATMKEGREAGASVEKRLLAGGSVAAFTTITEGLGGIATLKHLSLNKGLDIALREAANNAFQETLQTSFQEAVSTGAGFKKADFMASAVNVGKAALYGAFWGGSVAGVATAIKKGQVKKDMLAKGVPDRVADKIIDVMTEAAYENGTVQSEIDKIWAYETSPHNITEDERVKNFKEVEAAWKINVQQEVDKVKGPAPDKSMALEKVARGGELSKDEAGAFPELIPIQRIVKKLDEQIAGTKDRERKRSLRMTKEAVVNSLFEPGAEPAAPSTAESVPPAPTASGADRSIVAEKVARGRALTEEERGAMPDLAALEDDLDAVDDLLDQENLSKEQKSELEAERVGLLAKITFKKQKADEIAVEETLTETETGSTAAPKGKVGKFLGTQKGEKTIREADALKRSLRRQEQIAQASTLEERKRVKAAQKQADLNAEARDAFNKANPDIAILDSEALARSLARQAQTAKEAVKSERERVKQGELGKKAAESFKTRGQRVEDRILKSDAMKMIQKAREQASKIGAMFKAKQIAERLSLIRAIKNADIKGILAVDRHKIEALQALLPDIQKNNSLLKQLNDEIQAIKEASKEKFNALVEIREAMHRQSLGYLLNALGFKDKEAVKKGVFTSLTHPRQLGKELVLNGFTAKRVFNDLGPIFKQIFYDRFNRTESERFVLREKMMNAIEAIKKKHGLTPEMLGKSVEIDGIPFTVSEMMGITMIQSNEEHRTAVIEANGIPPETVEKIVSMVSKDAKLMGATADMAGWFEEIFPGMAAAVLDNSNGAQDLTKVKGVYMPIFRELDITEDIFDIITDDGQSRSFFGRGPGKPGPVKDRTVSKGGGPGRVRMSLFDNAYKYGEIASKYITQQRTLSELSRLVNDKVFREALKQSAGDPYLKYLDDYIKRIVDPMHYRKYDAWGSVSRVLREHASVLYIAGNLVTVAKQPLAMFFFLGNNGIGVSELGGAIGKYISDPKGTVQFMLDRDPQMRNRSVTRESEEQKVRMQMVTRPRSPLAKAGVPVPEVVERGSELFVNKSFAALNWMQTQVDVLGWTAAYDKAKALGKSEDDAIAAGQAAVLETQNAMSAKDAAPLFYSNDWLDLVAQFTDQPNKVYNILAKDLPLAWKRDDKEAAFMTVLGLAFGILLHSMVTKGEIPEDPEDWARLVSLEAINLVPVFGSAVTSAIQHYSGSPAGVSVVGAVGADVYQAGEAVLEGDYERAFQKIIRPIAVAMKLPFPKTTVERGLNTLKFFNEQLLDEVWSF